MSELFVAWSVWIDGKSYTDRFNPHVQALEVDDKAGTTSDTARITLSDTEGAIIMPRKGARIAIEIMGEAVFTGTTETPRFTFARGAGRLLILPAKGFDPEAGAKEGKHFHKDDATLEEYLKAFAKEAGVKTVKVDPELGKLKRPWWGPQGRSFIHHGEALARELGATFKMQGDTAVLAKRGEGKTPGGAQLPTIRAVVGVNVISLDIEPYEAREVFRDVRVRRFDRKAAKFVEEKVDIEAPDGAKSSAVMRGTRADADDAKARGKGKKAEAERDQGGGSAEINIEPRARAEGSCEIVGARTGVDGTYRIETAGHRVDKAGATTKLTLKQPGKGVGADTRKPGA
jgi:hypothetical protein